MNDHCNDATASRHHGRAVIDAYARHAAGANGFGDAGHHVRAVSAPRLEITANGIADVIVAVARSALRCLRVALVRWRRHRRARVTHSALSGLDDHTLRDLGLDRSEISSVATGASRRGDCTRARTWQARQRLYI